MWKKSVSGRVGHVKITYSLVLHHSFIYGNDKYSIILITLKQLSVVILSLTPELQDIKMVSV